MPSLAPPFGSPPTDKKLPSDTDGHSRFIEKGGLTYINPFLSEVQMKKRLPASPSGLQKKWSGDASLFSYLGRETMIGFFFFFFLSARPCFSRSMTASRGETTAPGPKSIIYVINGWTSSDRAYHEPRRRIAPERGKAID